jgi:hypothetical protein
MSKKSDALDLFAWTKRMLSGDEDEIIPIPKIVLTNLLALAERAPLRGPPTVKSGREQITEKLTWYRLRTEFRKRRDRGENPDQAVRSVRTEFTPRYPKVLQSISDATLRDRLTRRLTRRHR